MPVDEGPGKTVGIKSHCLQTSFELSRAETERPVSYDPSIPIDSFDLIERLVIVHLGGMRKRASP
jgi:hypothetical protein